MLLLLESSSIQPILQIQFTLKLEGQYMTNRDRHTDGHGETDRQTDRQTFIQSCQSSVVRVRTYVNGKPVNPSLTKRLVMMTKLVFNKKKPLREGDGGTSTTGWCIKASQKGYFTCSSIFCTASCVIGCCCRCQISCQLAPSDHVCF